MIVLGVGLSLAPARDRSALDGVDFLGGVLHGGVEHLIRAHAPELAAALGLGVAGAAKPYALLPPPFGWRAAEQGSGRHLPFGFVLHGPAVAHAHQLAAALAGWREIRLNGLVDQVRGVALSVGGPGRAPQAWQPGAAFPAVPSAAPSLFELPACRRIELRFLTPLVLESAGQRAAAPADAAPGLLRLVRALARRIQSSEPQLFAQISGADWLGDQESIRPLQAQATDWHSVTWRYGSRTKAAPVHFHGQLGRLTYRADAASAIPASVHRLLHWGAWFGAGQRTAFGQGMYLIQETVP